ncbi:MAG: FKBP-type peptidyl-prolyl cis-trans isomerase [Prevotella sp.]|jgi:FKBP-type peptidyl-prolyl cis-trans isomerase FklB
MKKILLLVAIFVAGASVSTIQAGKKKDKDKKKQKTEMGAPVVLSSRGDSLSFAAGYTATQGLLDYLQRQLHVDTAYMAEFIRGYNERIAKGNDPAYNAYIAGTQIAHQAENQILPSMKQNLEGTPDSIRAAIFHQGFLAGVSEDTTIYNGMTARELFETKSQEAKEAKNAAYKAENVAWLKDNATKPGVNVMASGLQYKVLKTGSGPKPAADQTVEVIYEGKTIDGNVFDATSRHHGKKTDSFRCNQVIKGWTEALTNMTVGSKWEIYIPQELAYGAHQAGQIKPFSTLIFTVELVGIEAPETSTSDTEK